MLRGTSLLFSGGSQRNNHHKQDPLELERSASCFQISWKAFRGWHTARNKQVCDNQFDVTPLQEATHGIPTHPLVPFPNGTKALSILLTSFGSSHRSGSNFNGSGKYSGSWCKTQELIETTDWDCVSKSYERNSACLPQQVWIRRWMSHHHQAHHEEVCLEHRRTSYLNISLTLFTVDTSTLPETLFYHRWLLRVNSFQIKR